jgi:hypothetical protein
MARLRAPANMQIQIARIGRVYLDIGIPLGLDVVMRLDGLMNKIAACGQARVLSFVSDLMPDH